MYSQNSDQALITERQRKSKLKQFLVKHKKSSSFRTEENTDREENIDRYQQKEYRNDDNLSVSRHRRNYHKNSNLPVIYDQKKSYDMKYQMKEQKSFRQKSESDKTQIYLRNCEDIIKNLRYLKSKKKKLQNRRYSTEESRQRQNQFLLTDFYHNDPNSNFKSYGTPYNKHLPPLESNNYYPRKKSSKKNTKSKELLIVQQSQSQTPAGLHEKEKAIKEEEKGKISYQYSPGLSSIRQIRTQTKQNKVQNPEKQRDINQKNQEYFIECVLELTKFLKQQNIDKEQKISRINIVQPQKVSKVSSKKSSSIAKIIEPLTNQRQIQTYSKLQTQRTSKQEIQTEQKPSQYHSNVNNLIEEAIYALNQLKNNNDVSMMKDKEKHQSTSRSRSPIDSYKQVYEDNDGILEEKRLSSRKLTPAQSRIEKKYVVAKNFSINTLENISINPSISQNEENKKQLVKQIIEHLQKQDEKNDELSNCLKELTQYLKEQNQGNFYESDSEKDKQKKRQKEKGTFQESEKDNEQRVKKQSLSIPQQPIEQVSEQFVEQKNKQTIQHETVQNFFTEPEPLRKSKSSEKSQEEHQTSPEKIIQNTVVRKLKKARLRGSKLTQKMRQYQKNNTKFQQYIQLTPSSRKFNSQNISSTLDPSRNQTQPTQIFNQESHEYP